MNSRIFLLIALLFLNSCNNQINKKSTNERLFVERPTVENMYELYGKNEYLQIYTLINDSISKRHKEGFTDHSKFNFNIALDSIFFINGDRDFIIGNEIRMETGGSKVRYFQQLFARKFNGNWYINYGASQSVSENSSYSEVHEVILKDISRRIYRKTPKGKLYVKEEMFDGQFSDRDLKQRVAKMNYPDSKHEWNYQQYFVEMSINTYYRETYWQLQYLPENYSFSYSKSKKELTVTAKIPYWHDFPIGHRSRWLLGSEKLVIGENRNVDIIRIGEKIKKRVIKNIGANEKLDFLFYIRMNRNPTGVETVVLRFKLTNGKVHFVKLVPHELELQDYAKSTSQDPEVLRLEWQKIIDETFGKNYGKNSKIRSVVVD